MEAEIITLFMGNGVGVAFGLLMYRMATGTIRDNTRALRELSEEIRRRNLNT